MTLPHRAVVWSAVCDCGISLSYSLTFLGIRLTLTISVLYIQLLSLDTISVFWFCIMNYAFQDFVIGYLLPGYKILHFDISFYNG